MRRRSRAPVLLGLGMVLVLPGPGWTLPGEFSKSLPMRYVLPAAGAPAGMVLTEISVSTYRLYGSPTPGGVIAREEGVLSARLRLSAGLTDRLHLWLEPERRRLTWITGDGEETSASGWGDLWLGVRLCPPGQESLLKFGIAGMTLLPAGSEDGGGRPGDFSTGISDYAVMALCDLDLSRFFGADRCVLHLNAGYRWHRNETDGSRVWPDVYPAVPAEENGRFNDPLLLRVGWSYTAHGISMESEFRGDGFVHARERIRWRQNPMSLTAALRASIGKQVWVRLGGEVAFSKGEPASSDMPDPDEAYPDWILHASVGRVWTPFWKMRIRKKRAKPGRACCRKLAMYNL